MLNVNFDQYEQEALNRINRIKDTLDCSTDTAAQISISMELCYISNELYSLNEKAATISVYADPVVQNMIRLNGVHDELDDIRESLDNINHTFMHKDFY